MKIKITKGKDFGKLAEVIKYMGDEMYRVLTQDGHRVILHITEFIKSEIIEKA